MPPGWVLGVLIVAVYGSVITTVVRCVIGAMNVTAEMRRREALIREKLSLDA